MNDSPITQAPLQPKRKFSISFDVPRVIIAVLVLVIIGMLATWRPWTPKHSSNDRTIEVTGQTTVSAEPDKYQFSPSYEFTNKDKAAANKAANEKSGSIVAALKQTGVEEKDIKTSITNYSGYYKPDGTYDTESYTYTLMVEISATNKDMAQKVQDYLNTTEPQGMVTPYTSFSESKRKELEDNARGDAIADARRKAEQSADSLGFKLSDVKTVNDGQDTFGIMSGEATAMSAGTAYDASFSSIMPGQNDVTYTVKVVYYVK